MSNEELQNVYGGAVKWAALGIISTAVTFIIGLVDGYFRPLKCRN